MGEKKKAVILGAGVGGIATSIYLAKAGYQVQIFEKNPQPGGRCGQIIREGHRFDIGATIFLMPSIYRNVFESLGLDLDELLKPKPLNTIYNLWFGDGTVFHFTPEPERLKPQMEALEPGSWEKLVEYKTIGYRLFVKSMRELLAKNFYTLFSFIQPKNIGLLFEIKTHIRHARYIRRFFDHPHLRTAFTFQNIYVGQNPLTAPALFSMLPAAELTEGSLFPTGGMFGVVEALLRKATEAGVELRCDCPVARIEVEGKTTRGVTLSDGTFVGADLVVANADLPYVYRELLPDRRRSAHLDRLKYSCSAIVFHWGMNKPYPQLGHHDVFLAQDYIQSLKSIFHDQSMADDPSFYIHAPVGTDASAAPQGKDSLSIIIPCGHLDPRKQQDWEELKLKARRGVLERLRKEGMDDVEENILFEICCMPANWENAVNVSKGSVFGSVNHSILQMGYFRPHNRHPQYKNLYFAGGSTHPGNGVPLVLLSSKLTAERIFREQKNPTA